MLKTLDNVDIKNKRVIIRCDFNVPIKNGKILDDNRIKMSLETINYCLDNNCSIILLSHLGRVKCEEDLKVNDLKPVGKAIEKLLKKKVKFINVTRGEKLDKAVNKMKSGDIILVQNTRYEDLDGKKESSCDLELAKYWASLGEVFINDAFGTMHRAHASNVGIAKFLPSCVGRLVEREVKVLSEIGKNKFTLILGGKKVSDKIKMIENLVDKVDYLLIGGGMANTFLKAEGFEIGNSVIDLDSLDFCKKMLKKYGDKIVLPVDVRVNKEFSDKGDILVKSIELINQDDIALDVGDETVLIYEKILKDSKLVFWNGPLGAYELSNFIKSTDDVLKYLIKSDIKTILGGGDVVAASNLLGLKDKVYHASTGGGATLEFLEGKTLPGIKAIK